MARSSKVEPCMFCGALPCECFDKPKKAAAPRKRAVKHTEELVTNRPVQNVELPEPSTSMRSAMKATAGKPQGRVETVQFPDHDEEEAAVRVLLEANILHPDEWIKYGHLVDHETRLRLWKERRHA